MKSRILNVKEISLEDSIKDLILILDQELAEEIFYTKIGKQILTILDYKKFQRKWKNHS